MQTHLFFGIWVLQQETAQCGRMAAGRQPPAAVLFAAVAVVVVCDVRAEEPRSTVRSREVLVTERSREASQTRVPPETAMEADARARSEAAARALLVDNEARASLASVAAGHTSGDDPGAEARVRDVMAMDEAALLAMVPDQCPMVHCPCPKCREYVKWQWTHTEPDRVACSRCRTVFPNDGHPMDRTASFLNFIGETITVPYHQGPEPERWTRGNPEPRRHFFGAAVDHEKYNWLKLQVRLLHCAYEATDEGGYARRVALVLDRLGQKRKHYLLHGGRGVGGFYKSTGGPHLTNGKPRSGGSRDLPYDWADGILHRWWGQEIEMVFARAYAGIRDSAALRQLSTEVGVDVGERIERDLIRAMVDFVMLVPWDRQWVSNLPGLKGSARTDSMARPLSASRAARQVRDHRPLVSSEPPTLCHRESMAMEKQEVFKLLSRHKKAELLRLLESVYDQLSTRQRRSVFGHLAKEATSTRVKPGTVVRDVRVFHHESLEGAYYAPFDMNSKNYMHVPEETEVWFERLGDLLKKSSQLSKQGAHADAVTCFALLYETVFAMEDGEEIVFAEEVGSWMIPVEEKEIIADYLVSLAAISSSEEFADAAIPLVRRDSSASLADKVYASARRAANKEQKAHLVAEVERQGIRVSPRRR